MLQTGYLIINQKMARKLAEMSHAPVVVGRSISIAVEKACNAKVRFWRCEK